MPAPQDVPVLLLGFNRPEKVAPVLAPLRAVGTRHLFVSLDGPRISKPSDAAACADTRAAFDQLIDWPCDIQRQYHDVNLGCRAAVSGAVTWALSQVEECLVLEDDCVIETGFLSLAAELLARHRGDEKIMHIGAANFQGGLRRGTGDYYVSKYAHCWGWATWRRAWQKYEDNLDTLATVVKPSFAKSLHASEDEVAYWQIIFERCKRGEVDSWAYRWLFSCWKEGGFALIPNVNLVSNLGFEENGTHTIEGESGLSPLGVLAGQSAPKELMPDRDADDHTFRSIFCPPLSAAEKQVFQHRIRHLKESLKLQKDEVSRLQTELKSEQKQPWWRR